MQHVQPSPVYPTQSFLLLQDDTKEEEAQVGLQPLPWVKGDTAAAGKDLTSVAGRWQGHQ